MKLKYNPLPWGLNDALVYDNVMSRTVTWQSTWHNPSSPPSLSLACLVQAPKSPNKDSIHRNIQQHRAAWPCRDDTPVHIWLQTADRRLRATVLSLTEYTQLRVKMGSESIKIDSYSSFVGFTNYAACYAGLYFYRRHRTSSYSTTIAQCGHKFNEQILLLKKYCL